MSPEREALIRKYAAGAISWDLLQRKSPGGYLAVLADLAQLGLRPPMAPAQDQERGRSILQAVLSSAVD